MLLARNWIKVIDMRWKYAYDELHTVANQASHFIYLSNTTAFLYVCTILINNNKSNEWDNCSCVYLEAHGRSALNNGRDFFFFFFFSILHFEAMNLFFPHFMVREYYKSLSTVCA